MENRIKPGDLVIIRGDREVRKVLDVRIYRRDDGYEERVLRLEGIASWIPEDRISVKIRSC